jgi:hypothetical protein
MLVRDLGHFQQLVLSIRSLDDVVPLNVDFEPRARVAACVDLGPAIVAGMRDPQVPVGREEVRVVYDEIDRAGHVLK